MSNKLKLKNPVLKDEEKTYLDAAYSSGTSLTVKNNEGFNNANWFVVVGEPGNEQTESQTIDSVTGNTTITIDSALKFSHPRSKPVYLTRWDKIAVERASNSGGSFSPITDSPFDIEWDDADLTTTVVDDAGASTDYYRWRFYNSQTSTYSAYSDELPASGLSRDSVGYAIKIVKKNPLARKVDDQTLMLYFSDFDEVVYEEMPKAWWFTRKGSPLSTTADTYTYSISNNWSDYASLRYLLYNYVNGSNDITYPLTYIPLPKFYAFKADANQTSDDNVRGYTILPPDSSDRKGYIGLHTTPATADCSIIPVYEVEATEYNSFGDNLLIPKVKGYVDYALYRIADEIERDTSLSNSYSARVGTTLRGLKTWAKKQHGEYRTLNYEGPKGRQMIFGSGMGIPNDTYRENYW